MSTKLRLGLTLSTTLILLAACGSKVSEEDIHTSTEQMDASIREIVEINKQLTEKEIVMNDQFKTLLTEDEELTSVKDESAEIIKNITDRRTLNEQFEEHLTSLNEESEAILLYEGTELSTEEIENLSLELQTFTENVTQYQEQYTETLDQQFDYLQQIAGDEANYEDFIDGNQTVNENYLAFQEETIALDQELVQLSNNVVSLNQAATEASEKELEPLQAIELNQPEEGQETAETGLFAVNNQRLLEIPNAFPQKFVYDSGVDIPYPEDGVKGVYVTAHSAGGERMNTLTELMNTTDLNAMVIDVKDDHGNVTLDLGSDNELVNEMTNILIDDSEGLMNHLEENQIYPIARIVVFKDTYLANAKPELSFTHTNGDVWSNRRDEAFVNPYLKEVWDYNVEIAIQAAKLGFKEVQFDYVRFPEGFELRDRELNYSHGHYGSDSEDVISMEYRNQAVTDFVAYAKEQLQPYGVDVSVDIFGYAAVVRETPGIGQSFPGIASEVDVISSMIYPSHWGLGNLDIAIPDLEPYNVVNNYAKIELEILDELGEDAPTTRPWIQDFTASYLGAGYYQVYGAHEVTEQIRALADNGIHEYLLWNAGNTYSENATFSFE